ncbi:MAG: AI-2E family transporter [Vulcanimicrobiaceae bacterium]
MARAVQEVMTSTGRFASFLAAIAGLLIVGWVVRAVLPIVVLALLYAILTWPFVQRLERRLPRALAILIVDAGIAAIVLSVAFALAPLLYSQVQTLLTALPQAAQTLFAGLPHSFRGSIANAIAQIDFNLVTWARDALQASFAVLRSAAAVAGAVILIPVLAAYLQLDQCRYRAALVAVTPARSRAQVLRVSAEVAAVVGRFIRGQILVSAIVGALVYLVLLACGVKFAGTIAILTAIVDLVPYLGGIAAFVPSLLFAFAFGGLAKALLVTALLAGVFELEAQVLSPQIVGQRTGLPPSVIVIAMLVGTALFGVLGLYLAVPVAAAARIVANAVLGAHAGSEEQAQDLRSVASANSGLS